MASSSRRGSLRRRFLAIAVFAGILPLVLFAVVLTRLAAHAGTDLLRAQLETALQSMGEQVERRWQVVRADLLLLANNAVVVEAMQRRVPPAAAPDWLVSAVGAASPVAVQVRYLDRGGRELWNLRSEQSFAERTEERRRSPDLIELRFPIEDAQPLGEMVALVRASALVPTDTAGRIPGSSFTVVDASSGRTVFTDDAGYRSDQQAELETATLRLQDPPFELRLAASATPYTAPFARAARTSSLLLLIVVSSVLVLIAVLTIRGTRSLQQLSEAAEAVQRGDLSAAVEVRGHDEVAQLAATFNEMTASLRRTLDELAQQRSMAAIGEFAAQLSHEVRNTLSSMRLDLQRASERVKQDHAARALLDRALHHVARLDTDVTGALRVARSGTVEQQVLPIIEPVRAAVESTRDEFRVRGGRVEIEDAADSAAVRGDRHALERLFTNLLRNAAQAGGSAVVHVTVDRSTARIVVRDSGSGMSADTLERLRSRPLSTKPDGSGLGLVIARQITRAHGGELRIDSSPGSGTEVMVELPAVH